MADNTNISDSSIIRPQGSQQPTLNILPTRGEKRFVPSPVAPAGAARSFANATSNGQPSIGGVRIATPNVSNAALTNAFNITAALEPLTDFVVVRLQNRGSDGQGNPTAKADAVYRFLINPASIAINHSTIDAQAFDRAGWQFGVFGDDLVRITLSGDTAGEYFTLGLTDEFAEFTESYRNLEQLQIVVENNGYWFEGEEVNPGNSLAAGFTRRLIKMHQDVILAVKEFLWYGMFESIEVSQDAEIPYLASFTLSFLAWKERFRSDSPYYDAKHNDVQHGNSYTAYADLTQPLTTTSPSAQSTIASSSVTAPPPPPSTQAGSTPAQGAEKQQSSFPTVSTLLKDYTPMSSVFGYKTTWSNFWQVVQD